MQESNLQPTLSYRRKALEPQGNLPCPAPLRNPGNSRTGSEPRKVGDNEAATGFLKSILAIGYVALRDVLYPGAHRSWT